MPTSIRSVLFLLFLFGLLFAYSWYDRSHNSIMLREEVVRPDVYMGNSKVYFKEHSQDRSIAQLELAIESIEHIMHELEEANQIEVGQSIAEMERVLDEMRSESLEMEELNRVFFKALNVLTKAELKVSETLLQSDKSTNAKIALKYAMYHLKNALEFSKGTKKEYEAHIYDEIDSLLEVRHLDDNYMLQRLEEMIAEIDAIMDEDPKGS